MMDQIKYGLECSIRHATPRQARKQARSRLLLVLVRVKLDAVWPESREEL